MAANAPANSSVHAASPSSSPATGCNGGVAQKPWLFVGLGNPGSMYKWTRHNVGFEMIDAIAEAEGISICSKHCEAMVGKGFIGDVPVMLAKPQTFMNASGESVGQLVSYFKIPLNQVVVANIVLEMKSVIHHFNESRDFLRLRNGIGRPTGMMSVSDFVIRASFHLPQVLASSADNVARIIPQECDLCKRSMSTARRNVE